MRRFVYSLVILLLASTCSSQIINIENRRIQSDTTGWLGSMGANFAFTKNVQEIINIGANVHLQYKSDKDLYLFLGNYSLLKGSSQTLANNMFYHLRYNRKLTKIVRWEAFTQWQQNIVTNIELRALLGTGPRFKLYDEKKLKLYVGVLAMYEYEKDRKPAEIHKDIRSDNYLSLTFLPNPILSITNTTFYQPLFRKFSDYRVLNELHMEIKATKHFSVITNLSYLFDTFPAEGTPKVNFTVSNGFNYNF